MKITNFFALEIMKTLVDYQTRRVVKIWSFSLIFQFTLGIQLHTYTLSWNI